MGWHHNVTTWCTNLDVFYFIIIIHHDTCIIWYHDTCIIHRFGDTAANAGMLALLDSLEATQQLPVGVKTLAASAAAGSFRILLMPVDACKTVLQVEGKDGLKVLANKIKTGGPTTLFHGALAASAATFVGMPIVVGGVVHMVVSMWWWWMIIRWCMLHV